MSRTRVTHLDISAPNGTPLSTTNSSAACGRGVHYTSVTNERVKVVCWYCKQTDLYNFNSNTILPTLPVSLGLTSSATVT